ncbi:MAG: protease [Gemmatimonadetes bacterium]|nr:protease [Gemmatimonadota bacterium]
MRLPSVLRAAAAACLFAACTASAQAPAVKGYFRFPAISSNTIVFTAEGDLWRVPIAGGVAQRLTTHASEETRAAISPDGATIAFSAAYEGPTEVYTMPVDGGQPTRRTFDGGVANVVGWTPDGRVLYSTRKFATLPNTQLATVDVKSGAVALVPLAQASDGGMDAGGTLYFTRFAWQGSNTKRYKGGTAQNIWKYARGANAAVPLTADWAGTSRAPLLWLGRLYFASDRDGTMNLWSMDLDGRQLKQHTHHASFDLLSPSLSNGKVAYQLGADLHVYDIAADRDAVVPVTLVSDFEQVREKWIRNPVDWINDVSLSPTGDRVAITARGQVFSVPTQQGRLVEVTPGKSARWRSAQFLQDGKTILALGDPSGEIEFWTLNADGSREQSQVTHGGDVLRWGGMPSPDGKWLAHTDKNQKLWVTNIATGKTTLVGTNKQGDYGDTRWSPDGSWLAYSAPAHNLFGQLYLYNVESGRSTPLTSERYDSYSPAFTPDGKWLYFLSDRHLESVVGSPWGARAPEPFFDKQAMVYAIALVPGERDPFQPDDELGAPRNTRADSAKVPTDTALIGRPSPAPAKQGVAAAPKSALVLDGIAQRLIEVPVPAGNYSNLTTDGKRLFFESIESASGARTQLRTFPIDNKKPEIDTYLADIRSYEMSANRKKLLVRKGTDIYVLDVGAKAPTDLSKSLVDLKSWVLHFDPREEWRQMFADAWRLERDYFYDRGMNGVDWVAMRAHYAPLIERATDRAEVNDVLAQMVGELSALHIFVRGGDLRRGTDAVLPGSLGARLARDQQGGGYRVEHIYQSDPDAPKDLSPLARYGVNVAEGDVIEAVNGVPTLSVSDIGDLLRDQADKQVLLKVHAKGGTARDVIVTPVTQARESALRYTEWEYTRRLAVEDRSQGNIGYVHLRAMTTGDIAQWARDFYPAFDRDGLIVDVRHNNGGNIDSWVLEKLMRKAWFYFQGRVGGQTWNMQYAFRGHVVVLTDESTASDGEAFAEGFRRLGLGKVIGTRTWGGEIWLSSSNILVDRGIATAAETGVYGPESQWLIEGHGVDPDMVVDNEPHATFEGKDAQLDAAIAYLQQEIKAHPTPVPAVPAYPKKALPLAPAGGGHN